MLWACHKSQAFPLPSYKVSHEAKEEEAPGDKNWLISSVCVKILHGDSDVDR